MTYLDTSALIKQFVEERGSPVVQRLLAAGEAATATIAYAEVYAALARRHRKGDLAVRAYAQVCRQFEGDWKALVRVELHDEILHSVRKLIQRHPLRGFDAIHLASALSLQDSLQEDTLFVAADEQLVRAARAEHLHTLNPEATDRDR